MLVHHEDYLSHDPGPFHPERRQRLEAIVERLRSRGQWDRCTVLSPEPCTRDDLLSCHAPELVSLVERLSARGGAIDADTPVMPGTHARACRAAGGAMLAARESVRRGEPSFALVRPPGHHAEQARACGFCYYNNVALAAKALLRDGLRRVLVLDVDAHHGNGTQDIFYRSPEVFYLSLHQDPRTLFPGTGFVTETGAGEGEGFNANVPLPPGTGDADYLWAFDEVFPRVYDRFRPEAVLVSIGFDAHANDPLTSLELTLASYQHVARELVRRTERLSYCLEGGYDLPSLGDGVSAVVGECLHEPVECRGRDAHAQPRPKVRETVRLLLEGLGL